MPRSPVAPFVALVFALASAAPASAQLFESGESGPRARSRPSTSFCCMKMRTFVRPTTRTRWWPKYGQWAGALAREGSLVAGEKLDETGMLLEIPGGAGTMLPGGDDGSPLGRLGGYFVISAGDRAEALAIAGTNPHLRHGGRIVVRPIVPT